MSVSVLTLRPSRLSYYFAVFEWSLAAGCLPSHLEVSSVSLAPLPAQEWISPVEGGAQGRSVSLPVKTWRCPSRRSSCWPNICRFPLKLFVVSRVKSNFFCSSTATFFSQGDQDISRPSLPLIGLSHHSYLNSTQSHLLNKSHLRGERALANQRHIRAGHEVVTLENNDAWVSSRWLPVKRFSRKIPKTT